MGVGVPAVRGLGLSSVGLGTLVYGFAAALGIMAVFAVPEHRARHPMLDVTLFANLCFTAASGASPSPSSRCSASSS